MQVNSSKTDNCLYLPVCVSVIIACWRKLRLAGYTGCEGRSPHGLTNKTVRSTGDVDEEGRG